MWETNSDCCQPHWDWLSFFLSADPKPHKKEWSHIQLYICWPDGKKTLCSELFQLMPSPWRPSKFHLITFCYGWTFLLLNSWLDFLALIRKCPALQRYRCRRLDHMVIIQQAGPTFGVGWGRPFPLKCNFSWNKCSTVDKANEREGVFAPAAFFGRARNNGALKQGTQTPDTPPLGVAQPTAGRHSRTLYLLGSVAQGEMVFLWKRAAWYGQS